MDESGRYVVTPTLDQDYLWVIHDPFVIPVEKLDGTNVSIVIEDHIIVRAYNRMNPIPMDKNHRLWQGIQNSINNQTISEYIDTLEDGQYFGELIGPGIQSNAMNLKEKLWIPFNSFGRMNLSYQDSWMKIDKSYDSIRTWLRNDVRSKLYQILHPESEEKIIPEGVVFHRPLTGEMSKLRSDMFDFWYEDPNHRPHKFIEKKEHKPKTPNPMVEEIKTLKCKEEQGLMSHDDFIKERNQILLKYGITPKE